MASKSSLESYANIALWFTAVAGVLSGVSWIFNAATGTTTGWTVTAQSIFFALACVGGITMGVLYALRRRSEA